MQIALIALGSRGDVQPYIALGKGLSLAGHTVRLATSPDFGALAQSHGLELWPLRGDVQAAVESDEMRALLEKGDFIAITAQTAKLAQRAAIDWAKDCLEACRGMDLIIAGIGGLFLGIAVAEKLDLPFLQAYLLPFTPTKAFPSVLLPAALPNLGGGLNRASHHLTRQAMWQGFRAADTSARQDVLGLPAAPFWGPFNSRRLRQHPILYGFSPSVIPKSSDWGANTHVTGYWFLDAESGWAPPPALTKFLKDVPPPIYIGFGSMTNRRPEETTELILEALRRAHQRAILLSGWGSLHKAAMPDTVFMADSIPHEWLFARVAAVVHHGGVGTTAAGLRAGVPSIITPFFGDQPFWGQRIAALGVGPKPIPRKKVTAESLAQAITTALTDEAMRQRAARLGAKIRAEDGVAAAVAVIQSIKESGIG